MLFGFVLRRPLRLLLLERRHPFALFLVDGFNLSRNLPLYFQFCLLLLALFLRLELDFFYALFVLLGFVFPLLLLKFLKLSIAFFPGFFHFPVEFFGCLRDLTVGLLFFFRSLRRFLSRPLGCGGYVLRTGNEGMRRFTGLVKCYGDAADFFTGPAEFRYCLRELLGIVTEGRSDDPLELTELSLQRLRRFAHVVKAMVVFHRRAAGFLQIRSEGLRGLYSAAVYRNLDIAETLGNVLSDVLDSLVDFAVIRLEYQFDLCHFVLPPRFRQ